VRDPKSSYAHQPESEPGNVRQNSQVSILTAPKQSNESLPLIDYDMYKTSTMTPETKNKNNIKKLP